MTRVLRLVAVVIALAAIVDPVFAVRRHAPLAVDLALPLAGEPTFAEAAALGDAALTTLGGRVNAGSGESPHVVIALGDAKLAPTPDVPVFVMPLASAPRVHAVSAPAVFAWSGQQPVVSASFRARGMSGRTTTFKLTVSDGATLGTVQHQWKADDETFAPSFTFASAAPGMAILRVTANTDGTPDSAADIVVTTSTRRARVLVFEPRPSWAVGFVRQAIELDPLFDVRAIARTSRGIVTRTAGAPESLSSMDLDSVDVVVVGGLDALTRDEIDVLTAFAARRGGSVVLVPDARVPENVRRAFELPELREVLLERPIELQQGNVTLKASEVLRTSPTQRPSDALTVLPRQNGQVMLSLALDAWRYRADAAASFGSFWRAVAAEAAVVSVPPLAVRLEPPIARPGDEVTLTASLRSVPPSDRLPLARASLIGTDGALQALRLWPGTTATEYVARFRAPAPGRYNVQVDLNGLPRYDTLLAVDADAARPATDRSAELALLARVTGGKVFSAADTAGLTRAVHALPSATQSRNVQPTRSPWWMLAFTGCLCAEWAIRRKRGQR